MGKFDPILEYLEAARARHAKMLGMYESGRLRTLGRQTGDQDWRDTTSVAIHALKNEIEGLDLQISGLKRHND